MTYILIVFIVLYVYEKIERHIEHKRWFAERRDLYNRIQSRDLAEYVNYKPILEPAKPPKPPKVDTHFEYPIPEPEAVSDVEAQAAINRLTS
jgi:hypothetical protein